MYLKLILKTRVCQENEHLLHKFSEYNRAVQRAIVFSIFHDLMTATKKALVNLVQCVPASMAAPQMLSC